MKLLFLVSAGGAIGAALRFMTYQAFAGLTVSRGGSLFPWATLTVNVVGSFLMGMAAVTITERFGASPEMRAFFMAGILGGFTTFSAFSLDVFELYAHRSPAVVGGYIGASVALSIGALGAGMFFARWIL
jgi:CrcB protein